MLSMEIPADFCSPDQRLGMATARNIENDAPPRRHKKNEACQECRLGAREAAIGGAGFPAHPQERHLRRGTECALAAPS
jgi:hypothetical protein